MTKEQIKLYEELKEELDSLEEKEDIFNLIMRRNSEGCSIYLGCSKNLYALSEDLASQFADIIKESLRVEREQIEEKIRKI